jgi:hypothetical protein
MIQKRPKETDIIFSKPSCWVSNIHACFPGICGTINKIGTPHLYLALNLILTVTEDLDGVPGQVPRWVRLRDE